MEVLSLTIKAGGARETWKSVVEGGRADDGPGGSPIQATTWRGAPSSQIEILNLLHHQPAPVKQYGGTAALWSAAGSLVRG